MDPNDHIIAILSLQQISDGIYKTQMQAPTGLAAVTGNFAM